MNFDNIHNLNDLKNYLLDSSDNVNTFISAFEDKVNWYEAETDYSWEWHEFDFENELNSNDSFIDIMEALKQIIEPQGVKPEVIIGDDIFNKTGEDEYDNVLEFFHSGSFADEMENYLEENGIEFDDMDMVEFKDDFQYDFINWLYSYKNVQVGFDKVVNEVMNTPIYLLLPIDDEYEDLSDPDNEFAKQFKDLEGTEFNVDVPGVLFKCTLNQFKELVNNMSNGNNCIITNSNIEELYIPMCGYVGGDYLSNKHSQQIFYPIGNLNDLYTITTEEWTYGYDLNFEDIKGFIKEEELRETPIAYYGEEVDIDHCCEMYIKSVVNSLVHEGFNAEQRQYVSEIIENSINERGVEEYLHIFESDNISVISESAIGSTFDFNNMPYDVKYAFVENVRNNFGVYNRYDCVTLGIKENLTVNLIEAYNTELLKPLKEHLEVLENGLELSKNTKIEQPKPNQNKAMKM